MTESFCPHCGESLTSDAARLAYEKRHLEKYKVGGSGKILYHGLHVQLFTVEEIEKILDIMWEKCDPENRHLFDQMQGSISHD